MTYSFAVAGLLAVLLGPVSSNAQQPANSKPPVTFTAEQDHQNMVDQLGIRALRPGPSGDEEDPKHANTDESLANPYPIYPDPLVMNNGTKITTPAMWWIQRRPEIISLFEREIIGRIPPNPPVVTWTVTKTLKTNIGLTPVIAKELTGVVDNSSYPAISVTISAVEVVPANAEGPVPLLMMFGRPILPAPIPPTPEELSKLNAGLKTLLADSDPALKTILSQYSDYNPVPPPSPAFVYTPGQDLPASFQLVNNGWGYLTIDPSSFQADNGAGLTRGIIGLMNKGQPRKPEDWGALRAWSWGAARALDYLETDPAVDAKHVGIEGVSRYGKAALVTMAFEPRFATVLIGSSGEGGVKPYRRNFGESIENLTGTGEYHWMAGNFLRYGAAESSFGSKTAADLPVDSPELIALCAPRLTFISYGIPESGDAKWLDQRGSFMAAVAAIPVFRLLGGKTLGVPDDYQHAVLPPVNHGLLDGQLAWRQHNGGHTDLPNINTFIHWANKKMAETETP